MPDPTIDKLLDRIELLENALKEIDIITLYEGTLTLEKIHKIATKALWPV